MTIADRIKKVRTEKELSQADLAKLAGYYDKSAISKIEHSGNDISMKQVKRIALALNISPAYLMGWEDEVSAQVQEKISLSAEDYAINNAEKLDDSYKKIESYAIRLYELYSKASPEVQLAVDLMLKSSQPKS